MAGSIAKEVTRAGILPAFERRTRSRLTLPAEYELLQFFVQPTAESDERHETNTDGNLPAFVGHNSDGGRGLRFCVHCFTFLPFFH